MKLERLTIISLVLPFLIPFLPGTEARSDVAPLQLCLGAAADYSPVYPTNTFPSNTQELTAVFHQSKTEAHKKLSGTWIAVNVGNAAPPNYVIAKTDLAEEQGMDLFICPGGRAGDYDYRSSSRSYPWCRWKVTGNSNFHCSWY